MTLEDEAFGLTTWCRSSLKEFFLPFWQLCTKTQETHQEVLYLSAMMHTVVVIFAGSHTLSHTHTHRGRAHHNLPLPTQIFFCCMLSNAVFVQLFSVHACSPSLSSRPPVFQSFFSRLLYFRTCNLLTTGCTGKKVRVMKNPRCPRLRLCLATYNNNGPNTRSLQESRMAVSQGSNMNGCRSIPGLAIHRRRMAAFCLTCLVFGKGTFLRQGRGLLNSLPLNK